MEKKYCIMLDYTMIFKFLYYENLRLENCIFINLLNLMLVVEF